MLLILSNYKNKHKNIYTPKYIVLGNGYERVEKTNERNHVLQTKHT